ncbi:hypothetical protein C8Q69DRAFT_144234 [Paecilomyces variotii]|uniref:Uncharacterized protein n=1 Tax=Byssochlamys spectabilis TaxID=264951 RepID=A0A443I0Q8_BYSSP|nr:hypothetical protein C8Q69DRAFT_144234 [Paecilomyces variotii]RWQ97655.1 hypothetical protein C8Q69DRAFT_144234 [Paecilomyces variotii]
MVERLLDFLHLDLLAQFVRSFKNALTDPPDVRAQKDWISEYECDEQRGVELLQLKHYWEDEKRELIRETARKSTAKDIDENYTKTLKAYDREIANVRQRLFIHQNAMKKLLEEKIDMSYTRSWELPRRRTRQGFSLAWLKESKICARTGGCCGRPCACCEKPLVTHLERCSGLFEKGKKVVGLYGHCTTNCRCCILYRRLPKKELSVGSS